MSDTVSTDYEPDVRVVGISQVRANGYNPNEMEADMFDLLTEAVRSEGMNQPVLVRPDPDNEGGFIVVDGEHRFKVAKATGLKRLAVVVVPYTEEQAKVRTISMNQMRGQFIPIKLARMLVDLQKTYSDTEIRRMTGIAEDEQLSLSMLMAVPDLPTSDVATISLDQTDRPIHVHLLLMPDEHGCWDEAMKKAMEMVGPDVTPLVGVQVHSYDEAMRTSMKLAGVKLRNVALALICRAFTKLDPELQATLIEDARNHVILGVKGPVA